MNKAIFLDRDGTLNVEVDYLHEPDKLRLIAGVPEALNIFKDLGYKLIVISNQSGIGRGYFGQEDVDKVNSCMNEMLESYNVQIDAFYYCPHIESDNCNCRKPKTGLYERAVSDWNIDVAQSYMAGDKESDVLAARNIGCGYGLLLCGHDIDDSVKERYSGHIYRDLLDFAYSLREKNKCHLKILW